MITLKKTSAFIRDRIRQKRKLSKIWQRTRHPEDKTNLIEQQTSSREFYRFPVESDQKIDQLKLYISHL